MPIYEYQCDQCGRIEEVLQKITDKPLAQCHHCKGNLHKLISQSAFHLKGTGWYVTDYAGKSQKQNKNSDTSPPSQSTESSESKSSDTKKTDSSD